MTSPRHLPVLLREITRILAGDGRRILVDGTVGLGGHSHALLSASPEAFLIGIDRDQNALCEATQVLNPWLKLNPPRAKLIHANYSDMNRVLGHHSGQVDGVLLDLGVSSIQLDCADRGFSFQKDGPLDMRMDQTQDLTAAHLVNGCHKDELEAIFMEYGEEPRWRRVSEGIIEARRKEKITSTAQLAKVVAPLCQVRRRPDGGWKIHPATLVFQAL